MNGMSRPSCQPNSTNLLPPPPPGRGPKVFRVQGQICHRSGELVPPEGTPPSYAQLYVYDPAEALEHRAAANPDADRNTLATLQDLLTSTNPYAEQYLHMQEVPAEAQSYGCEHRHARLQPYIFQE